MRLQSMSGIAPSDTTGIHLFHELVPVRTRRQNGLKRPQSRKIVELLVVNQVDWISAFGEVLQRAQKHFPQSDNGFVTITKVFFRTVPDRAHALCRASVLLRRIDGGYACVSRCSLLRSILQVIIRRVAQATVI